MSQDDAAPEGVAPLTRAEYEAASPRAQGFMTYMQGAWNPEVPNSCPYLVGSTKHKQFQQGEFQAMLAAQEGDD